MSPSSSHARIPTVTRQDVAEALGTLGVAPGDVLMVHSSLSSFGHVAGGADAVLDGILDVLSPQGTLVVPTITYSEAFYGPGPPVFDVRDSPSPCGIITETLRLRPRTVRSLHPLESAAACGRFAEAVCWRHELSVGPCGLTSPYGRLVALDGWILLMGVGNNRNTTLHVAEELAHLPGLYTQPLPLPVTDADGTAHIMEFVLYTRTPRDFGRADEYLRDISHFADVGASRWTLMKAREMTDVMVDILEHDPEALLRSRSGAV